MAGLARLSGGPSFQPGLSGFNIAEVGNNWDPVSSALGFAGNQQQMANGAYPDSNPYLKFFGMPMRDGRPVPLPQNREHFDWAEAYDQASVPAVTRYTITQLMESDMVLCRTVLPFVVTEDRIDIKWNEWHFNDAMLDPRPAETASRLLSCSFTQGSDTMQTMGRAMEMEDGFYKTEAGQRHFVMQWKQLVNATATTLEFGAATALANVRQPGNAQVEQMRSGISSEQLRAIVTREVNLFNCVTRGGGIDIAIEHCMRILAARGAPASDTVIVPDGTAKHINDPTFRPYYLTGVKVPEHPSTEVRYKNMRIISSRLHNVGGEGPPQDPHFRWVTTGTCYGSDHNITWDMDINEYRTIIRGERIFDETNNDYAQISLEHMLTMSGLFTAIERGVWVLSNQIGMQFFGGCATIGEYYAMQNKTLRLAHDHYANLQVQADAGYRYDLLEEKTTAPPGGRESYIARSAFLKDTHGPGDAIFQHLRPTEEPLFFYNSSRDLIDSILDLDIVHIGSWFQWCLLANVPIPVSFVLCNPYQRWYAGLLQVMKAGTELGGTFIGHFDVQAGRDYVRKMLGLHVTAMMKSIVVNPKLIANAHNVLVKGYDGGAGVRPWDPNSNEDTRNFEHGNTQHNDQFVFAVNNIKPMWAVDICGRFNPQIVTGPDNVDRKGDIERAYHTAASSVDTRKVEALTRRSRYFESCLNPSDAASKPRAPPTDPDGKSIAPPDQPRPTSTQQPYSQRTVADLTQVREYHKLMRTQHYTSAHIYSRFWRFEQWVGATPTSVIEAVKPKTNTLCLPGHQFSASPTGTYSLVRVNKDHRGPYIYQGCGAVRTGLAISLEKPSYIGSGFESASTLLSIIQ